MSTFSNLGPSKIYPNWNFWFEKKPSGNPITIDEFKNMKASNVDYESRTGKALLK
jgi:hypothetical protein